MKNAVFILLGCLAPLLFHGCGQETEWEEPIGLEKEIDTFYLVNTNGDTLPTGEKIELDKAPRPLYWVSRSYLPQKGASNIWSEGRKKESNEVQVTLIYESLFYADSTHAKWEWNNPNDTLEHPSPIFTTGRITPLETESRERLSPPDYKENAIADIQFLSIDQGLLSSNISEVLIDVRGITWIATDKGLVRYDGVYATNYTKSSGLPSNSISCLEEGKNGEIWMGFYTGGFAKFDGNTLTVFDQKSCRFSPRVNDLTFDKNGNLLIGTLGAGLCVYDGAKINIYDRSYYLASHKDLGSFAKDSQGDIWFMNFGSGVWNYNDTDMRGYHHKSGILDGWLASVFVDSKNRKWIGGTTSTFYVIENDSIRHFRAGLDQNSYITCFAEDSEGTIWMGTSHFGVLKYDGESIQQYGTNQGLSSNAVGSLLFDEFGKLWVGTLGGGCSIINTKSFEFIGENQGLPSSRVNGITEHNGKTYYATDQGLAVDNGNSIISLIGYDGPDHQSNLKNHANWDVLVTKKDVVFTAANNFGIARYILDLGYVRRLGGNTGMPQNPSAVAINTNGSTYGVSGEKNRLFCFTDTSAFRWDFEHGFAITSASDMEFDKENRLWIASYKHGVCLFDSTSWFYYTTNEGLSSNSIQDLYIDNDDRVWLATNNGLDYIENGEIHTVNFEDASYASEVQSIIQDNEGGYWIGLFKGLLHLVPKSPSKEWDLNNYEVILVSKNDGLVNSSCLTDAMYVSEDGKIYIGTEGGLIVKDPSLEIESNIQPTASLLKIDINTREIDFNRVKERGYLAAKNLPEELVLNKSVPFYNYPASLELPYAFNHITFHFEGAYHGAETPQRLNYEYYIKGYDESWIQGPKEQKADYRNLPYGDFEFHLRSFIDRENPSEEFIYPFTILPPWYHTWWARIIFVLIFVFVVWVTIRIRTRSLLARQLELEETVEQRTQELKLKHEQLEESHQEIKDSIVYAKRIQNAILPPPRVVKQYLKESFILYKPKDIVAGDFYWMEQVNDKILFAAADCTGHGVPGAMVSVVCNNALNRSVREFGISEPGKILDKARDIVIEEFEKSEEDVKDGMDIALCSLEGDHLKYAGANNPLWIVRDGEIIETKANKQPIGKFDNPTPYTTHSLDLVKGDVVYIFSDGYVDQFGGEKGKKFKAKALRTLLLEIQDQPMEKQKTLIDDAFELWKGSLEQIDDVCIIGVKI